MGMLALGTYWLVAQHTRAATCGPAGSGAHEPDYFMKQFFGARPLTNRGRVKSEVFGAAARHFPDTDTLEIDAVHIRSFDDKGRLTTATARAGLDQQDGPRCSCSVNARDRAPCRSTGAGQTSPRIEFRGEFLHAYHQHRTRGLDKPVEITARQGPVQRRQYGLRQPETPDGDAGAGQGRDGPSGARLDQAGKAVAKLGLHHRRVQRDIGQAWRCVIYQAGYAVAWWRAATRSDQIMA
jgi:lipopolysaccharide export system protein LptC